jgi:hypothetical protein
MSTITASQPRTSRQAAPRTDADRVPSRLGRYTDHHSGTTREIVCLPGAAGSRLVIDRDAITLGDRRLVAHLAADEPQENAALVCEHYLQDPAGRWCRRVTPEDREVVPFADTEQIAAQSGATPSATALTDRQGRTYCLELHSTGMSIPQLRWCRRSPTMEPTSSEPVSMREAIASLESYEPVRTLTHTALALHRDDPEVSIAVLRAERERMEVSKIVLNRGLRAAVQREVARGQVSMSEIAMRCGRIKHDKRGNESGETSWLARRIGQLAEGGQDGPSPWVHTDVLALIVRDGLGATPREIELG